MIQRHAPHLIRQSTLETELLKISGVTVRREQTIILNDLSLTIPCGRHTAVLGPNGSGKSSLLKLLTRDFYPSIHADGTQGDVLILGESEWEVQQLRRRMGVVTPVLDSEFGHGRTGQMTVRQAIASGFTATRLHRFGPQLDDQMQDQIDQAMSRVKMCDYEHRKVMTLSTGERRRTLIARAIVHQPEIFVLDEPTSGLDIAAKAEFTDILSDLVDQDAMTILLVTHHVDEIPPAMQHVVLLDQGQVVFDGAKQEALTDARLSQLFSADVAIERRPTGWYQASVQ